jgi:hypothetical protein
VAMDTEFPGVVARPIGESQEQESALCTFHGRDPYFLILPVIKTKP